MRKKSNWMYKADCDTWSTAIHCKDLKLADLKLYCISVGNQKYFCDVMQKLKRWSSPPGWWRPAQRTGDLSPLAVQLSSAPENAGHAWEMSGWKWTRVSYGFPGNRTSCGGVKTLSGLYISESQAILECERWRKAYLLSRVAVSLATEIGREEK